MADTNEPDLTARQHQLALLRRTEAEWTAAGMPEAVLAPLRAQIAELQAQLGLAGVELSTAAGDTVWRDKHVRGDDVAGDKVGGHKILATLHDGSQLIGGNVHGLTVITPNGIQITLAPDDVPPEALLAAYYRSLAGDACRLPLGVIDVEYARASGNHSPPLPEVYVDLDVVAPPPEKEADSERGWALHMARGEGSDRLPLLEALSRPEGRLAVLLGDAGSGKTTFVNYVAYQVASGKSGLPEDWRSPLVARFVLREVAARHIPAQARRGEAQMLWNALADDIAACLGRAAAERLLAHLQARLLREGGLILLDGLDEVPAAGQRRKVLLEAVRDLAESLPAETTRILVTARPYAYADKAWRLPGFATLALAPFSEAQVQRFVDRWYQAVRPSMLQWSELTARGKGQGLQQAIDERPYLADLASRPLLLTLMATLHSSWGTLPEDRAGLYEETVKLLLGRWQRAREVRGPDGQLVMEQGISEVLGVGEDRIRSALQDLAYTVHTRQRRDQDGQEGPADIGEGEVLVAFKPLLGAVDPDTLLAYLQERAGLLLSRREGVYAFPHRSFQEYLAACRLADRPDFAQQVQGLAWQDPLWWREVVLLAAGKAKQGGLGNAFGLVSTLLPALEEVEDIGETHWRVATLAGLALHELRLVEKAKSEQPYQAILKRVRRWLVRLMEGGHLPPRERLEAGDTLGWLGDPRPGVAVLASDRSLPDIAWVEIPAGPFTMGTADDDEMAWDDEKPLHSVTLPLYYIARYPLTNAQFRPFVEGDGYSNPAYWTAEGWAWRQGADADLSVIDDADLRQQYQRWLAGRPAERRNCPFWWDDRRLAAPNRPVVGVSWHEALAYTCWLEARLHAAGGQLRLAQGPPVLIPAGYRIALPSEAEWEKAARGADGRRWPWGADWEAGRANSEEAGLEQTSPVGLFPAGAGPYGLLDAAGNVWEWTRSKWGRRAYTVDYGYPYDPLDGREELSGPDWRIVRGGSWGNEQRFVRCAYRNRRIPSDFIDYHGVRVVVSLANSGF